MKNIIVFMIFLSIVVYKHLVILVKMGISKSDIGNRLLELRRYAGLSRASISQQSGIPVVTIRSWEAGQVDIRQNNLEKYLEAFASRGCFASYPYSKMDEVKYLQVQAHESLSIGSVIEMLTMTSNLFYYLDKDERILYLNSKWRIFLGLEETKLPDDATLHDLCSSEVYAACHTNYIKSLNGEKVAFSYSLSNQYSKRAPEANMLYMPVFNKKGGRAIGVLGFLSANTLAQEQVLIS